MERERTREPEPGSGPIYEKALRWREEFVHRQMTAPLIIRGESREFELSRQGKIRYYLNPQVYTDSCLQDWFVFLHEISGVSGRHRHQGGLVIFVLEGSGYTTINGERHDWNAGDLVLLPLVPGGVEHQHFNLTPDGSAKWLAFVHEPTYDEVASELVQTEISAEWKANFGG